MAVLTSCGDNNNGRAPRPGRTQANQILDLFTPFF
jgi:hypothetical protein